MSTGPRRSSRQSTPTSPPPSTGGKRSSMPVSASTPSLSSLAPPSSVRKSASTRSLSPAPLSARPALPERAANSMMASWSGKLHKVKIQTLHLGNAGTITIARVKCPVPKGVPGHIIKRFDTDAVSASSLFRAAFPTATEGEESVEMNWIAKGSRARYGDTKKAGAEHDETRKLSGVWIPASKAAVLAEEYKISRFAADLIAYIPIAQRTEVIDIADSEGEQSPAAARSPRTKRARFGSPPVPKSPLATNSVSILQTLETDAVNGVTTETTEVQIDVPASTSELAVSDETAAQQIEDAKKLAASFKENAPQSMPVASKKRSLEVEEEEEEALPETGTLADTRGFFGKIFKRAPRRGSAPRTASREIKPAGSQLAVVEKQVETVEGRRWVAGLGLAVAVTATAAAPYLFG
ncbi:transcription regulator HTH, APSES-type [Pseudohyphozyma bogoriensis]|nr:transcription regulator HTH, APSES-type [Pseudohyphozyma bogoriensis]